MAKRSTKPPKKREQPWLAAAREKLRVNGPGVRDESAIQDAFEELATAASSAAPGADAAVPLARARVAWNLPLVHALSTAPGSEGAEVREQVARWLSGSAEEIAAVVPLARDRLERFGHLRRPIVHVYAQPPLLALTVGREAVTEDALIPVDERGWPSAGHVLLVLAAVARPLFPDEGSTEHAGAMVSLAELSWNLHTLDQYEAAIPAAACAELRGKAAALRAATKATADTLDEMVALRRTRFGHDRRLLRVQSVRIVGADVRMTVASVDPRDMKRG
jgi:hypothetical protein